MTSEPTPDSALSAFQQAAGKTGDSWNDKEVQDYYTNLEAMVGRAGVRLMKNPGENIESLSIRVSSQLASLTAERDTGMREALRLANGIYRAEFMREAPEWKPLDTIAGIISQIDNMYAGVRGQRDEARFALATATRQNEEMGAEVASAAQIGDALRECATRLLGMVKADKVSFADFGHREATTINLWQLVEMSRELRTPGSTKWGTKDAQDHYESIRRKYSAALSQVEGMRGALNQILKEVPACDGNGGLYHMHHDENGE